MKIKNGITLLSAAFIWGIAFVWQDMASEVISPFSFSCIRFGVGAIFLFLLSMVVDLITRNNEKKKGNELKICNKASLRRHFVVGIVCGAILCIMTVCQQYSFNDPNMTSGKCGFLTATYILFVPLLRIFLKKIPSLNVWVGVLLGLVGLYFLCVFGELTISWGDFFVIICALMNSIHILVVDHFLPKLDPLKLCCIQCFFVSLFSFPFMIFIEHPTMQNVLDAALPVLLCGIVSSGIAYSLQLLGQKGANPTIASMIMSLESVFSVIAGAIILQQLLPIHQQIGCLLIFAGIIIAQMPSFSQLRKKKDKNRN